MYPEFPITVIYFDNEKEECRVIIHSLVEIFTYLEEFNTSYDGVVYDKSGREVELIVEPWNTDYTFRLKERR